jgi:hypothetical protein
MTDNKDKTNAVEDPSTKDVEAPSSESSEDDDDSLVLEGVLVRNPEVDSSSDDSDDDEDDDEDDEDDEDDDDEKVATAKSTEKAVAKRLAASNGAQAKRQKKKARKTKKTGGEPEIDLVHVDLVFCDMAEAYWHGLKALLSNGTSLYQAHSSLLADQMIAHERVGTLIATPDDPDHSVYGFGSLLHWAHFGTAQSAFHEVCAQAAYHPNAGVQLPDEEACREGVVELLASDQAASTVVFLLMGRMVNLPLEIVLALHQQVWLDVEWAQQQPSQDDKKKKKKQKGAAPAPLSFAKPTVLRVAPCTREGQDWVYRYFEDELLAGQAQGSYVVEAPVSFSREDKVYLRVLQLNLPGYQKAIGDLERLVGGTAR